MSNKLDVKRIFLEQPQTIGERVILFIVLMITFMIFFTPLKFSTIHPIEAFILSLFPSASISWGWIVFLRLVFKKSEYIKDE